MLSKYFLERPVFAWVISIAMMAVGLAMVIGLWDLWMAWLRQWVSQFGTLL